MPPLSLSLTLSFVGLTTVSSLAGLFYFKRSGKKLRPSERKIVFITGCDSGLGFSLAQHAADMGFTVFATFLSIESSGANEIRRLYGSRIVQLKLDITDNRNVLEAVAKLEHYLNEHPEYSMYEHS